MTRWTIGLGAIVLTLLTLFSLPQGAAAIGTAFTYQGQLQQSGSPGTGPCDFRFMLFDTAGNGSPPTGGNQIGNAAAADGVQVSTGLFTLRLDFGAAAFNTGSDRWLQIAVRCPAGSGSYQTLAPRQPLTPAPFALFASAVADGSISSAKLAAGAVATSQLAANAVTAAQIADGTIATNDLANGAVSTAKIGDGQVTSAKLVAPLRLTSSVANSIIGAFDGASTGLNGVGVSGTAGSGTQSVGVRGENDGGDGVRGTSRTGAGVRGQSTSGVGVVGLGGPQNYGVSGFGRLGVIGFTSATDGTGVAGLSQGENDANAVGVHGIADKGTGVRGESESGYAGFFVGVVHVAGVLTAGTKLFKIDHPLDPANKYLMHASVESPDMKNIYDGVVVLDTNGEAVVDLPEWFEALNRDFCYQLTCIGGAAPVYVAEEVNETHFRIAGGTPGLKVSWQVTGIRKDAFAVAHPMVVEPEKSADERGRYLDPIAQGMPASLSVDRAKQLPIHKQLAIELEKSAR